MTSPVIDESVMQKFLRTPTAADIVKNIRELQTGGFLLMLDAYDRKVTRDRFEQIIGNALGLIDALARHSQMISVKNFLVDKTYLTLADVEMSLSGLGSCVQRLADDAADHAEALAQCPNDEDRIN